MDNDRDYWSFSAPDEEGFYWFRETMQDPPRIVKIVRRDLNAKPKGYISCQIESPNDNSL